MKPDIKSEHYLIREKIMKKEHSANPSVKKKYIDPGSALLVLYVLFVAMTLLLANTLAVKAEERLSALPDKIDQGELYRIEEGGYLVASPLEKEVVKMSVSGIVNRVVVEQYFTNTTDRWIEAVYAFPLPEESAVDHLVLRTGEREIVGVIQQKKEAKATYEKAKKEGHKASLLVQHRPNIFTTRIANIAPGEKIVAKIEYQQTVHYENGTFSLRFPLVIFPRYIPGKPLQRKEATEGVTNGSGLSFSDEGWALDTDIVPDASAITPPVDLTGDQPIPVELSIDLAAGVALGNITSLYHGIKREKVEKGHYRIHFTGEVKADRDFLLEWQPKNTSTTRAALFSEQKDGEKYSLLMVMPPHKKNAQPAPFRELIFILDISGSMAGPSLDQAKEATKLAIERLRPQDSFNIIVFNNEAHSLFGKPVAGDAKNRAAALSMVDRLQADGGTEMRSALTLALDGKKEHSRLRQIIFLTDGAVGNERELMNLIAKNLGDSRLFTVGIGSAPNSCFMKEAANHGRGSHLYIGDISEVKSRMEELFLKLENPALCNIHIEGEDPAELEKMEIFPTPLSDLYYGEPLFIAIRGVTGQTLQLGGDFAGKKWQTTLSTESFSNRAGIAVLWAKKKVHSLMAASSLYGMDSDKLRQEVTAIGIKHHLVTDYTSLVAVDKKVSRPNGSDLKKRVVKSPLPAGAQADMIFAGAARSGTDSQMRILLGLIFLGISILFFRRRVTQ